MISIIEHLNNQQKNFIFNYMSKLTTLNKNQKDNIIALKKISSLALKIAEMIENEADCYKILQQLKALSGLIKKTQTRTMQCSLEQFLEDKVDQKKYKEIEEIIKSLNLFNK